MIPFYTPAIDEKMILYVTECLQSGWLNTGPWVQRWELALKNYCGTDEVLAVSSNTIGLELSLRWLGIKAGDEVIVPAYSYCAAAHVVWNLGAKPVFWDCGVNLLPDPELLPSLLNAKTRAVIAVDFGGLNADYKQIKNILNTFGKSGVFKAQNSIQEQLSRPLLIADAAHSIGAISNGIHSGSLADLSVFSFHSAKNITTGDGGAVCIKLPESFTATEVKAWMQSVSLHGKSKMAEHTKASGNFGYDVDYPGIKGNLSDFQAAMGLAQLERYESEILPARTKIALKYSEVFSEFEWAGFPHPGNEFIRNAWHIYPLIIRWISAEKKNKLIQFVSDQGVGVSMHYTPVPALEFYRKSGYDMADYPQSGRMAASEITLPLYEKLSAENQERVIEIVLAGVKKFI